MEKLRGEKRRTRKEEGQGRPGKKDCGCWEKCPHILIKADTFENAVYMTRWFLSTVAFSRCFCTQE